MPASHEDILDIASLRSAEARAAEGEPFLPARRSVRPLVSGPAPSLHGRPWLAVLWRCCHTYSRIYRDRSGESYTGRCPGCRKRIRALVGSDGISNRFFEAY